ncbi:hypothetical protein B2G47_00285 [Leptospira interrogans serovar Canicola]|nr:hypothetical protein B2G47_00285 [Leptospira interrogans serovar Canicola]
MRLKRTALIADFLKKVITPRTYENNTKLLTTEFAKKITILKNTANWDLRHFRTGQNIQIFETIEPKYSIYTSK